MDNVLRTFIVICFIGSIYQTIIGFMNIESSNCINHLNTNIWLIMTGIFGMICTFSMLMYVKCAGYDNTDKLFVKYSIYIYTFLKCGFTIIGSFIVLKSCEIHRSNTTTGLLIISLIFEYFFCGTIFIIIAETIYIKYVIHDNYVQII